MCYRPITIWNNSLHYNISKPLQYNVPCGHCEACLDSRRMDWYVRAYYEYLFTQRQRGCTVVYTLTYSPSKVNYFNGRTAFRESDFQKFIKRLRSYLFDHYSHLKFSYLACPEYGELYQRPHYHVIFNIMSDSPDYLVRTLDFYQAVQATWQQGFIHVKKGSQYGKVISLSALRYVTKYVTKGEISYNLFSVNYSAARYAYHRYLHDNVFDEVLSFRDVVNICLEGRYKDSIFESYYKLFSKYRNELTPKVHASLGFGQCVTLYLTSRDKELGELLVPVGNEYISYRFPLYVRRKLWYNRVPNERDGKLTRYVLSDEGISHFSSSLLRLIEKVKDSYHNFLLSSFSDSDYGNIGYKLPYRFRGKDEFLDYLRYYEDRFLEVAIYSVVYKGTLLNERIISFNLFDFEVYFYHYCQTKLLTYKHENKADVSFFDRSDKITLIRSLDYGASKHFELHKNLETCLSLAMQAQSLSKKRAVKETQTYIKKINDSLKCQTK